MAMIPTWFVFGQHTSGQQSYEIGASHFSLVFRREHILFFFNVVHVTDCKYISVSFNA